MSQHDGLNRRAFLRNAGMTALVGAVGTNSSAAAVAAGAAFGAPDPHAKYDFDTPYNRFGTDSVKYDQQIRIYGKDSVQVGMGIADMDFRAAPAITKALTERLQHENWGYLDMPKSFAEGIVSWNKRRYGININPDSLVITTGVHPGLIAALRTFSPPGTKVLLNTPTYNGFYGDLTYTGTIPEENPLKLVNGRYSIDFEDFERRISHNTNTFILCNPQNPTGNCWSAEDLTRLGEICLRRRVVVLADEIHCDFVTNGHDCQPGGVHRRRGLARSVRGVYRRQPRLRPVVRRREHSDDQGRQAAGHLPLVAGRHRGGRQDRREGAGRRSEQGHVWQAADARADDRASFRQDREGPHESRGLVRSGRRQPHADEYRDVPENPRVGAQQPGDCVETHDVFSSVAPVRANG
ncbi:MAG: hypothetical protein DMD48_05635 [Gemmatimonadetes bacterium]|nr:MAG: hypothetical protein DMD48_05635 [Gemmatimonadota bacterium]